MLSETNHKALLSAYLSGNISKDELRSKTYANTFLFGVVDEVLNTSRYSSSIDGILHLTEAEAEARPEENKMFVKVVKPE